MEKKSSSSSGSNTTKRMVSMVPPRSLSSAMPPPSSSSSSSTSSTASSPGPIVKRRKPKRRRDLPHVVERLSKDSLKRYLRYYKLKSKNPALLHSDVACHFDALHVDEHEVITRFCKAVVQTSREKRRR